MATDYTIYAQAPGLTLDKVAELNAVLVKLKDQDSKSSKFWFSVRDTMVFAWKYMKDMEFILERNKVLEAENRFLRSYSEELSERLQPYEIIRKEIMKDRLNVTIKVVEKNIIEGNGN
jgi:hypothetical protein